MLNFELSFDIRSPFFYVFVLFAGVWFVQMVYYWIVFGSLAFYRKKEIQNQFRKPVSVVICARNEYLNLKKFLPMILEQDYPDFEVVVVDDGSDDETNYLLKDFKELYPHLSIVDFKKNVNFFSGKKFPLALGIKSAKNDILILTDADCYPSSKHWLRNIVSHYEINNKIVLAYSPYEKQKGLLNMLIRYDAFFTAVQYLSYALRKIPYMGVGRNLSYHRDVFVKNKGFSSHYHIMSGDDDLFINQVASKENYAIEISKESQMVSMPKQTFIDWIKQKKRHFTTFTFYKTSHKLLLGFFSISNFLYYPSLIALIILKYNLLIILSLVVLRLFTRLFIIKKCINKISEQKLLLISLVFDFFLTYLHPLIGLVNLISKKKKWN
ncbi:MAG: glycosyltransferase [Bacteroidales bacterium]|nr:glycosyltransferase [Bacteroidales bacterium]